ncbi:FtsW/RodA/SpoVE family cell cycle protein [Massilia sp. IC2-476]|uniref:FtsW/RodA/SpoVE family cell cycle protein n=1 Tax=Massilia sp. IC2-476 TaxID=2887199 RepID=UPI001D120DFD|nr:FtsW/RodA/SpoVE family cell cycle protein [Massilia sp. IC2-476]MCC2972589.1 FtsW/RodA/SpoVE family cell cycle protein [Massilia sp. IC2-476]
MNPRFVGAAAALCLLCGLQLLAILLAPPRYLPREIALQLAPGATQTLGRAELAAPGAAPQQFTVRRDGAGRWLLRNASPAQAVVLVRGGERQHTGSAVLATGQRLQAGATVFEVGAAHDGRVLLRDANHAWEYDGALLLRDGQPQVSCPDAGMAARLSSIWNRVAPGALAFRRPLAFGGHLYCGNRLAVPGLDPGRLSIARAPLGDLVLQVRGSQPVLLQDGGRWEDAAQREHALAGMDAIAVGGTRFALAIDGNTLRLQPAAQVALFAQPKTELPGAVHWTWSERSLWRFTPPSTTAWCGALAALLLASLAGLRLAGSARTAIASALLPAAAVLLLVMQRSGAGPGAGWTLLLAWGALWHALLWPRRLSLLGVVSVLLLGAGLLVQLELGLGARDSAWLRHVETSCVLLAVGLPLGLLLLGGLARGALSRPVTEWLLVLLAIAALGGLLLQVAFGDETGVFEIQPVEFAKLALAALSAHCLALATSGVAGKDARRHWRDWLRPLVPVLLFVLLLAVALVQVDDYSPLILLLVWGAVTLLAWCLATGRQLGAGLVGGACCALLAGALALQSAGPGLAGSFYAERFQVWADPTVHPHTGQQMLLGARAVQEGGWRGADGLLGITSLGGPAGDALRIPAVQDDFAPSFLINRHGLAGALLLWFLQAALLAALLHAAAAAWRVAGGAGDFRRAWLGRFQCFLLAGGAAFLGGHFLLSWGTNLALFPIMGQPMSFLSAGGSHLLFFICPLLAFGMASVQSFEENQSCRSTSNTKSWPR